MRPDGGGAWPSGSRARRSSGWCGTARAWATSPTRRPSEAKAGRLELDVRDPDVPLSDTGRAQAEALGKWLAELPEDERPTAALSSPFNRALTTAQLATENLGIRVRTDERLRERDFGAFDGMTGAGIREQYPDEAERRDLLGKFYYRPPGGESWADVALRIRSVLATEGLRYDCERLLVVAHQAVIMVFRYVLEELTEQELLEVDRDEQVANASLTRYDRDADGNLRLTSFNEVEHLTDRGRRSHQGARCRSPSPDPTIVTPEVLRGWQLPEPTGDKNTRGSILVIGGSSETLGAVLLAAEAAMRAGAGKLQVATVGVGRPVRRRRAARGAGAVAAGDGRRGDQRRRRRRGARPGRGGRRRPDRAGHGRQGGTQEFGARLLPHLRGPLALDALGLACVTADDACLHHLDGRVVLTPNPMELAYALHADEDELADDPAGAAAALAERARAVVGLGGVTSWVAAPDGALWRDDSGAAGLGVSGVGRRTGRDHRRPARPRRRPGPGGGLGGLPPRPLRRAAVVDRRAGWASWPASCRRRFPGHSPRSPAESADRQLRPRCAGGGVLRPERGERFRDAGRAGAAAGRSSATTMVDTLIRIAPTAGARTTPASASTPAASGTRRGCSRRPRPGSAASCGSWPGTGR